MNTNCSPSEYFPAAHLIFNVLDNSFNHMILCKFIIIYPIEIIKVEAIINQYLKIVNDTAAFLSHKYIKNDLIFFLTNRVPKNFFEKYIRHFTVLEAGVKNSKTILENGPGNFFESLLINQNVTYGYGLMKASLIRDIF